MLGALLVDGAGGTVNDTEAVRYLRLSASQGRDVAQKQLGDMHEAGRGVVQDRAEARAGTNWRQSRGLQMPFTV
jgi:TPR repeat protein